MIVRGSYTPEKKIASLVRTAPNDASRVRSDERAIIALVKLDNLGVAGDDGHLRRGPSRGVGRGAATRPPIWRRGRGRRPARARGSASAESGSTHRRRAGLRASPVLWTFPLAHVETSIPRRRDGRAPRARQPGGALARASAVRDRSRTRGRPRRRVRPPRGGARGDGPRECARRGRPRRRAGCGDAPAVAGREAGAVSGGEVVVGCRGTVDGDVRVGGGAEPAGRGAKRGLADEPLEARTLGDGSPRGRGRPRRGSSGRGRRPTTRRATWRGRGRSASGRRDAARCTARGRGRGTGPRG